MKLIRFIQDCFVDLFPVDPLTILIDLFPIDPLIILVDLGPILGKDFWPPRPPPLPSPLQKKNVQFFCSFQVIFKHITTFTSFFLLCFCRFA